MFDICLLGTGGMLPLPNRWLSSMIIRFKGSMVLVDCGEGTQIAIKEYGWGFKNIDAICFTHFHADHISGLPGMLLSLGNYERKKPLKLIGPKGLEKVVNCLRIIAPSLPFEIEIIEIELENNMEIQVGDYYINSCSAEHEIPCITYSFSTKRPGKFNPKKSLDLNIPKKYWSLLQIGEKIEFEGNLITPSMVMGEPRKGFKVSYCTDSRPSRNIIDFVKESDLFICEGMYGEEEKIDKAISNKHMIFSEAATMAKISKVKELWLTHFSPSLNNPEDFKENAQNIFENVKIGYDGMTRSLNYEETEYE